MAGLPRRQDIFARFNPILRRELRLAIQISSVIFFGVCEIDYNEVNIRSLLDSEVIPFKSDNHGGGEAGRHCLRWHGW